jgi:hypothetical protein
LQAAHAIVPVDGWLNPLENHFATPTREILRNARLQPGKVLNRQLFEPNMPFLRPTREGDNAIEVFPVKRGLTLTQLTARLFEVCMLVDSSALIE